MAHRSINNSELHSMIDKVLTSILHKYIPYNDFVKNVFVEVLYSLDRNKVYNLDRKVLIEQLLNKNSDKIKSFIENYYDEDMLDNEFYQMNFEKVLYNKLDENIIKYTCKELGLTYKELGEIIGYTEGALKTAVSSNKVSNSLNKAIALYKKILKLEKDLENSNQMKKSLREWLKAED